MIKYDTYKPSGIEWLGDIPSHWDIEKVKWIFRHVTQMAEKNNDYELLSVYTDIGVKPRKELEDRGNKATTTDNYWIVKKGDIIVNKLLAWMGAVGLSNYDGVTSPAYDVLRPIIEMDVRYYNYIFRSSQTLSEFKKRSKGIMEMRLRLYFDELGQILFPLPPKEEQKAISDFLDKKCESIDTYILKQKEIIELLKEKKSSLINNAVIKGLDKEVEYKDSGVEWIGKIPKHWEIKKLKYLVKHIIGGGTPSSSTQHYWADNINNGFMWVSIADITKSSFIQDTDRYISKQGLNNSSARLVKPYSILYSIYASLGKVAYSDQELSTNQAILSLELKENIVYYKYMFYVLLNTTQYITKLSNSTTQNNISLEILKNILVSFPGIKEQKLIVSYIEKESKKIDDTISHIEDELKLLEEYKQSVISSAVTGKIKVS